VTVGRLLCAVVAGLAIGYAVDEFLRLRAGRRRRLVGRGQAVRRIVGALMVGALMVLVDVGLEVLEPMSQPNAFVAVWSAASLLVLVLFCLALLDWRELRANQELETARQILRERSDRERPDSQL